MGNYRFRLSDMMPNAWFYKLKEMRKSRNQKMIRPTRKEQHPTSSSDSSSSSNVAAPGLSSKREGPRQHPHLSSQRKSYYFTRDLSAPPPANDHDRTFYDDHEDHVTGSSPPRKSCRKKRTTTRRSRAVSSSNYTTSPGPWQVRSSVISAECNCRATIPSVWTAEPDSTAPEEYQNPPPDTDSPSSDDQSLVVVPEFCSSHGTPAETTVQGLVPGSASCRCESVENRALLNQPELVKNFSEPYSVPKLGGFGSKASEIPDLPPIITNKPACSKISKEREERNYEPRCRLRRSEHRSLSVKAVKDGNLSRSNYDQSFKEHKKTSNTTCPAPPVATVLVSSSSPGAVGLKLRTKSPRIADMRIQFQARKSLSSSHSSFSKSRGRSGRRRSVSESFAVVKSSKDPESDFRESMMEMIAENSIRASKDLEDLLACYLSLNSDQYHDLIIRVFKQIWFDIVDLHHPN